MASGGAGGTLSEDDASRENSALFNRIWDATERRKFSNGEQYDSALLTLSVAVLGGSLAFLGDVKELVNPEAIWRLHASWWCLLGVVVITLVSFLLSSIAQDHYVINARAWLILKTCDELRVPRLFSIVQWCGWVGGALLASGLGLTVSFVSNCTLEVRPSESRPGSDVEARPEGNQEGGALAAAAPAAPQGSAASTPEKIIEVVVKAGNTNYELEFAARVMRRSQDLSNRK